MEAASTNPAAPPIGPHGRTGVIVQRQTQARGGQGDRRRRIGVLDVQPMRHPEAPRLHQRGEGSRADSPRTDDESAAVRTRFAGLKSGAFQTDNLQAEKR
jgi:hypothetical protein